MVAYFGSVKVGEVVASTWRPFDDQGIIGTLILSLSDYEKPAGPVELTLVDTRDGVTGTIKFKEFQITSETGADYEVGVSFVASEVREWTPLGA